MSIQSEINRINGNVAAAYAAAEGKGAEMPSSQNTDNLAQTVSSIPIITAAQAERINNALQKTGDIMVGPLRFTEGQNYGATFPADAEDGTIFFVPQ